MELIIFENKKVLTQFRLWPLLTSQLKGIPGLEKKYCRNYSFSARRLIALTFLPICFFAYLVFLFQRRKFFRKKFSLIVVDSRLRHSVNADYEEKIPDPSFFFKFIFSVLWRYVDFTKAHRAAKARIFLPVSPRKIRSATLQIKIF